MITMSNKLSTWLAKELNERSWSARELARRIGMSQTSISRYVEGSLIPSPKTCLKIAAAFGIPDPLEVMRLAGHLPPLPPAVIEEREAIAILRSLPSASRGVVMQMLRSLSTAQPTRAVAEPMPAYTITIDDEIAELIELYPRLEPFFEEARELPQQALRALIINVRIWIEGKEQRFKYKFANLHRKLSDFLTAM